jgi:hypothetical protein
MALSKRALPFWRRPLRAKRCALVALLVVLVAAGAARADVDTFQDVTGRSRGDSDLQADTFDCWVKVGRTRSGQPTPPAFKRCMLARGWRYEKTEPGYYDRKKGLMCRPSSFLGMSADVCTPE